MASPPSSSSDSARDELADLLQPFMKSIAGFSARLPSPVDGQRLHSIVTVVVLACSIVFAWKFLKAPRQHRRRQRQVPDQFPALSDASSHTSTMVQGLEAFPSSGDSRVQDVVDDFFQAASLTIPQLVRHKFSEGQKVTCRLLGIVLEETNLDDLQRSVTVKASVLEILLEMTKFCDLYLMERILDDESEVKVVSALNDAGIFTSGSFVSDKVLFCSTDNGRVSFVRQLEPDWHIDTDFEIVSQLARFIKYQLHISPTRPDRPASNVFSSTSLERFIGVPDHN
ncbi:putative peroxisome biogenesis protein [Dioscorea sansibarensis]